MSGDHTRFTFDPGKLFSGVHKQQGRVSLDSDFNEFEEILGRRNRSSTYDTVGRAVVPATTPDGFKIGVIGSTLTIGTGRAYVDGLQAECFGDLTDPSNAIYDAVLGNLIGPAPLPFDDQPFHYSPSFPAIASSGVNLVYLDVWQREVTSWEDEGLLDPALGGPDTATRVQTAWQVKALSPVAADACTNPPQSWVDLTAPSTARMTATASAAPPAPGPCVIQPAGGYTGIENRLYRVEVHKAGTLGGSTPATFKWSRDNASLVASALKITGAGTSSVISVESTGRDTWMRFAVSQQVELLDDFVELAIRETGIGGSVARITNVNHATGEITIDQDLSAFAVVASRHPRIRRWDTATPADAAVRDVSNGTAIPLEEGISISFGDGTVGHDGDTMHAGDYWIFAARTADGSIEVVEDAPPRGILHHFTPLAIVTSGTPPSVDDDCRDPWPVPCDCEGGGGCECDYCVSIESHASNELTVQDAVDRAVADGGGTVCIGPGRFQLDGRGLVIADAPAIRVRGSGVTTILEYTGDDPALLIERAIDVSVHDFVIVTQRTGEVEHDAVQVGNAAVVNLERLAVVEDPAALIEVIGSGVSRRPLGAAVALHGILVAATIRDCFLAGAAGIASGASGKRRETTYLITADLAIRDNLVLGTEDGIRLDDAGGRLTIACFDRTELSGNSVYGCMHAGVTLAGIGPDRVLDGTVVIRDSTLGVLGDGIAVGMNGAVVEDNVVESLGHRRSVDDRGGRGISLISGGDRRLQDVRVAANRIGEFAGDGIAIDARVTSVNVMDNLVRDCGGGIVMSQASSGERVTVGGNTILGVPLATPDDRKAFGILLVATSRAEIIENHVQQLDTRERDGLPI